MAPTPPPAATHRLNWRNRLPSSAIDTNTIPPTPPSNSSHRNVPSHSPSSTGYSRRPSRSSHRKVKSGESSSGEEERQSSRKVDEVYSIIHAMVEEGIRLESIQASSLPNGDRPHDLAVANLEYYNRFATYLEAHLRSRHVNNDPSLKQLSIQVLSNLMVAHPNLAQPKLGELGFTGESVEERCNNIALLTQVVEKKGSLNFIPVEESRAKLLEIVRKPGLVLALAMVECASTADAEELATLFLTLFRSSTLLKALIEKEVSLTENSSSIFRSNSFCSRIITQHARLNGNAYLRTTLGDLILSLCDAPPNFSTEHGSHLSDEAATNLETVASAFLVTLIESDVPLAIREICAIIAQSVAVKFPESEFTAGAFLFLRFIVPAIVSPEKLDLDVPEENRNIRRGLVLVGKILQALANNTFGGKEIGISCTNPWIDQSIVKMARFISSLSELRPDDRVESHIEIDSLDTSEFDHLHRFLVNHRDQISSKLSKDYAGQVQMEEVDGVLEELAKSSRVGHVASYDQFMSRLGSTFFPFLSSVFFVETDNESGAPTLCIVLAGLNLSVVQDFESFAHFILDVISKSLGDFQILLDCTQSSPLIESISAATRLFTLLPPSITHRITRIIVVNPNAAFRRDLRTFSSILKDQVNFRNFTAISSNELDKYFKDVSFLPQATLSLLKTDYTLYDQISEKNVDYLIELQIYRNNSVAIISSRKQILYGDIKSFLVEILVDIEEVRSCSGEEGFSLQLAGKTRHFFVPDRSTQREILNRLSTLRSRIPTTSKLVISPPFRPSLSFFAHVILFNLGDSDSRVRGCAMLLAKSVANRFNFQLVEDFAEGGYVPNSSALIVSISEQFAALAPNESVEYLYDITSIIPLASTQTALLILHATRPWIQSHLATLIHASRNDSHISKLTRFFRMLIRISSEDASLHLVCSSLYQSIGKIDVLIPLFLDELVASSTASEVLASSDAYGDIAVSLSAGILARGKIIHRLRKVIIRTNSARISSSSLMNSDLWDEIMSLVKLDLSLSYDHRQSALLLFPEIVHVCTSLFFTTIEVRAMAQQILVNTVTSLIVYDDERIDTDGLRISLGQLSQPVSTCSLETDEVLNSRLSFLLQITSNVIDQASSCQDQANTLKARSTSLTMSTAFQRSFIQRSAFLALANLGTCEFETEDIIYQLLSSLQSHLLSKVADIPVIVTIVECLKFTIEGVMIRESLFPLVFALLQCGCRAIGLSAIKLLEVLLDGLGEDLLEEGLMSIFTTFSTFPYNSCRASEAIKRITTMAVEIISSAVSPALSRAAHAVLAHVSTLSHISKSNSKDSGVQAINFEFRLAVDEVDDQVRDHMSMAASIVSHLLNP